MKSELTLNSSVISLASSLSKRTVYSMFIRNMGLSIRSILPGSLPVRFCILMLMVWCFMIQMAIRAVMSVAVPAITTNCDTTVAEEMAKELSMEDSNTISFSMKTNETWSKSTQNLVFSSFYWGYLLTQLPGGYLAERYGAKMVLGVSQGGSAIMALLIPLMTHHVGGVGVVAIRFIQGLLTGPVYPSLYPMIARWFPSGERQTVNSIMQAVQLFSIAITYSMSGYLIALLGWPSVFYVVGGIGVLWLVFWVAFMYDRPHDHPTITKEERKKIASDEDITPREYTHPPYLKILLSAPVWAVVISEIANSWGQTFLLNYVPSYLTDVVGQDIRQSALFSSLPYVGRGLTGIVLGITGDWVLSRGWMSVISIRRTSMLISFGGCAAAMLALTFTEPCELVVILCFCLAAFFNSFINLGYSVNTIDISPTFCGTVYALANTCGGVASLINPLVVGAVVRDRSDPSHWHIVFYIATAIYGAALGLYLLLASAKRQPWDGSEQQQDSGADPTTQPDIKVQL